MKKLTWIGYRFCLWFVFLISVILLALSAIVEMDYKTHIEWGERGTLLVSYMLALGIAIFFIWMYKKISDKGKVLSIVLFFCIFILQILFLLFVSHPMTFSDPARVQNEALRMIYYQNGQMNPENPYLKSYPNNHFITILFYYYYKILAAGGIAKVWLPTVILNFILFDLGIVFTYFGAKKIKGIAVANITLLIFLLSPTTYVWLTSAYTNTFSFPFLMGTLYFGLMLREHFQTLGDWIKYALLGFICVLGTFIRPTTAIAAIALVIYHAVCFFQERGQKKKVTGAESTKDIVDAEDDSTVDKAEGIKAENSSKHTLAQPVIKAVLLLVVCAVTYMGCHKLIARHVDAEKFTGNFPTIHWVMMGLNEEHAGGFLRTDSEFTRSFPTLEEKKEHDMQRLKQRVKKLGIFGIGKLYLKKMIRVWTLGDDDSIRWNQNAYSYPVLYNYFMGQNNRWYLFYNQSFRIATFLLMLIALLRQLRMRECTPVFPYALTFLGAVLFFMIWEAGRRYNVCFNGIYLFLMAEGASFGSSYVKGKKSSLATVVVGAICLLVSGVLIYGEQGSDTKKDVTLYYCNRLSNDAVSISSFGVKTPNVLEQTIGEEQLGLTNRWNRLTIYFNKTGKQKDRKEWKIEVVSRDNDEIVYTEEISVKDLGKQGAFTIKIPNKIKGQSNGGYLLRLTHLGEKFNLLPKVQPFPVLNPYPYGSLTVDGYNRGWDLAMKIYAVKLNRARD